MDLAYAVVHGESPDVYAAEDIELLQWVIAIEVVSATPASTLDAGTAQTLRQALLEERWGDAVEVWMEASGIVIDVYPDGLRVWTSDMLQADLASVRLQFRPLFTD